MAALEYRLSHPTIFKRVFSDPELLKSMVATFMLTDPGTITDLELLNLDVASSRIDGKPEVQGFLVKVNGELVYFKLPM